MVSIKLAGFIDDNAAELKSVKPNQVDLRVGRGTFFGGWGKTMDRQPVRLVLDISDPQRMGVHASEVSVITATVTPVGRIRRSEVFEARALTVLQQLRAYFAAD
jgi:hypothetical protein